MNGQKKIKENQNVPNFHRQEECKNRNAFLRDRKYVICEVNYMLAREVN